MIPIRFRIVFLFTLLLSVVFLNSCSEDLPNDTDNALQEFNLYMTDCPFEAEEVNVEILKVIVEDEDGNSEELTTNAGIYNLLEFTDGVDTLLAFGNLSLDDVKHIYFELGDQNTIVVDGQSFPLQLKDDNTVKVKVNLNKLDDEDYLVDFFACTSIIKNNDGYFLKPVIKFKGKKLKDDEDYDEILEDILEDLEECYALVYPVSLIDEEAEVYTANNKEELILIVTENDIEDVVYPISVIDQDGELIAINSKEEAKELEDCDDDDDDDDDEIEETLEELEECYDFVYPIEMIDASGNLYSVENADQLKTILDDYAIVDFVYPFTLTDKDGEELVMNALDELEELDDDDCDDDDDDDDDDDEIEEILEELEECYDFVYPIEMIDASGNLYAAENADQLKTILDDYAIVDFVYPFTLTDKDGGELVMNALDELEELDDDDCDDDDDEDDDSEIEEILEELEECYDFVYPIEMIDASGNLYAAENADQLKTILDDYAIVDFVYPFTLTDKDGEELVMNALDELEELDDDDCDDDDDDDDDDDEDDEDEILEDIIECYTLEFPFSYIDKDGNVLTANDLSALEQILDDNEMEDFVYPFTIIDDDGTSIQIDDKEDLEGLDLDC